MAAESLIGLSSMENDMKMLSSEKKIIENEGHNFKISIADMEKEREVHNNELNDTIDNCTILSSEFEKAMLTEDEVHTLLAEKQKLEAQLQNLDMECCKLRETIVDTKAENESLIKEKHMVESKVQQLKMDLNGLSLEKEKLVDNMNRKLSIVAQEKEILASEKNVVVTTFLNTESKLKEKAQQISNLQATINDLEAAKIDLHNEVMVYQEEKTITLAQLQQVEASLKNLENQLEQQVKKNSEIQKTNEDLVLENSKLQNEVLEMQREKSEALTSIVDLESKLVEVKRILQTKIVALHEEKDATLLELHASQASLRNFQSVVKKQNESISSLQQANDELQKTITILTEESEKVKVKMQEEIEAMDKQLTILRKSFHAKIAALYEEKDAALLELQASQTSVKNFESLKEKQNVEISYLHRANEDLQKTIGTMTEETEKAKAKLQEEIKSTDKQLVEMRRSLHAKIATLHEERDATLLELQASQTSLKNIESVVEKKNEDILSLRQANDDLQNTISTLAVETEKAKAQLQEEVKDMEKQLVEMRRSLHAKIAALHKEKDAALLDLQASQAYVRNIDSVVDKHNKRISSQKQANDELHKAICILTEKSERAKAQFQEELVEVRRGLHAKVAALHEEKDATQLKLHVAQASIKNYESVVEEHNKRISSLQQANDQLQRAIYTLTEHSAHTKTKLQEEVKAMEMQLVETRRSLHVKIAALHEEKDATQIELQKSKTSVRDIESVIEKQNDTISSLQQANDELQKTITILTKESEKAKVEMQEEIEAMDKQLTIMKKSLHGKIAALHEEKDAAVFELQASHTSIRNFESLVEKQNEDISHLHRANNDLQKTICTMTEETEKAKAKFQEEIKARDKQLVEMRRSLHAKIAALHEEKDATLLDLHASQAYMRNIDSMLEKHNKSISSQKQVNDELQKAICILTEESERAKAQFQDELMAVRRGLHAKVAVLHEEKDATLQAAQASIRNYESVVEEQNKRISSLQQANDQLQGAIYTMTEQSVQAKAKLQEEVKAMEMQLVEMRRSLHVKIVALHDQKDAAQLELQTSQASVRDIKSVVKKQNDTISSLQQANDELHKTITTLTKESEKAKVKMQDEIEAMDKQLTVMRKSLHAKITALHEEKDATLLELQASQASVSHFESLVEKQNEDISYLRRANDDLQKTICTMTEETEKAKAKWQEEIKATDKQLVEMRRSLHAKIATLHEERDATLLELQASQTSLKNFEGVVEKQNEDILSLRQANDDLQNTISTLVVETEKAKAQLQKDVKGMEKQLVEMRRSLHAKIATLHEEKDAAMLDLQASQAYVRNIDSVVDKHNKSISSQKQANDELQKTICILTEKSEQAKAQFQEELVEVRRGLHAKVAALHEEKDAAQLELQKSKASVRDIESVMEKQNDTISSFQQANDELQKAITTLTEESEKVKVKMQEEIEAMDKQLSVMRKSLHAKIAALHEEKDAALLELQTSQASVRNFESLVEMKNEDISYLHRANDDLQKTILTMAEEMEKAKAKLQEEIKAMDKQLVEMRRSFHAKIAALHEERDATLLKLQASQASVRNFESVVEKQNGYISSLQQAYDVLEKEIGTLTEQSQQANGKLQEEVKAAQEEKHMVILQLKQSEAFIKNLENEVACLRKELSVQLEKNSTLDKRLEKFQAEMASNIVDLSLNTKALENTINVLSSEKTKVQEDLKILVQACSGNMSSMKEFEETVKQRITDDVTKLGPLYQSLGEVLSSYRKLQYAYDEMSARASQVVVLKENQMEQIDKINRLKEEKVNTFMENAKLHKNVQYLEFQLQHVKQKLMENKWKEDRFATTLVTSQAEIQNLEQLVSLLEETFKEVKEHAELGGLSLAEQLDKLESSFNQGFPRFVYRSSTCSEDIKVLRKKLHDHLDQQKELLKKKEELAISLRNKEKVLSELVKNDVEARNLEKEVDEKESGGDITNNTVTTSKRWPSLRRRRWRRNSYSC